MNKRIVSMIQKLACLEQPLTLSELSEGFHISQRTVRNDLNTVNDLLKQQNLSRLKLGKGGAILREEDFPEILGSIDEKDFYDYKLSKDERKKIASVLLVTTSEYITLSEIADHMAVSRATIINDLDDIKSYIRTGNLEVLSHPNKGLHVDGTESDRRVFLLGLVNYNPDAAREDVVQKQLRVDEERNELLGKILHEQEHVHESFLSDSSFQKIQTYLEIMVKRIQQGCMVEPRKRMENSKYSMAEDILKYVGQYCSLEIKEDEIQFLSELLSFGRYMKQKCMDPDTVKIQMLTRQFIEAVSGTLGIELTQDYDFFENLSKHLESTLTLTQPLSEKNPVVDSVVEENSFILDAVRKNLMRIESYAGRGLSEAETGYIVVHVCAAVERRKNQTISFRVILACHAGIGTSQLLQERLKKYFNFQIMDIVSSHEAGSLKKNQADLVISTVPLKNCAIESVVVSPLLRDEDYIQIGNKIDQLRNQSIFEVEDQAGQKTSAKLLGEILYECVPEEASALMEKIEKTVADFFKTQTQPEQEGYAPKLSQLLPASHIQLNVDCRDWKEAVQKSAEKLLELGYIEESYIDAMICNIEENGPYVVLTKGFAVPHEGIDKGVRKTGFYLIRLQEPLNFGAEEYDPVEFVCCMSAVDHKKHLRAFFNLVNMLKIQEFMKALRQCETAEETADIIRQFEELAESRGDR